MKTFVNKQETYYKNDSGNVDRLATPGSQYIMQLIRGGYLEDYSDFKGKILDVGCGGGFNLVSFCMLGWDVRGVEISEEIASYAAGNARRYGYDVEVRVGGNRELPFPDASFDLLTSVNAIHYVNDEDEMEENVAEHARVIRPGGRMLTLTTHPENWILKESVARGPNVRELRVPGEFRDKETFFVFNNHEEIRATFSPYYDDLKIGINRLEFFEKTILNFVITGKRKPEQGE